VITSTLRNNGVGFGVDISVAGVTYVTQASSTLVRVDLPVPQISGSVAVGSIPTSIAFDRTGATAFVTNQYSQNLGVIDVATNTQRTTVPIAGSPFVVAVSPDNRTLYVTSGSNGMVNIVDATTLTVTGTIPVASAPNGLAFHPTAPLLYVSSAGGGTVFEIDLGAKAIKRTFTFGSMLQGISVSPDGRELYVADETGTLYFWDITANASLAALPLGGGGFGLAMTRDATQIYVSLPASGSVVVVDRVGRSIVRSIATGGRPRRIGFDRCGQTAVIANEGGWTDLIK
jgi:YVTN family beta-propeller protein